MMKMNMLKRCKLMFLSAAAAAAMVFPSSAAAAQGKITKVDSASISGWAWNPDDTNDVQQVEIHILPSGKSEPVKYFHTTANQYREELVAELKDGWHGFSVKVDWSQINGSDFKVRAYAVKDGNYYTLGEPVSYSKPSSGSAKPVPEASAKAASEKASDVPAVPVTQITAVQPPAASGSSPSGSASSGIDPAGITVVSSAASPVSAGPGYASGPGYGTKAGDLVMPLPEGMSPLVSERSLGIFSISGYCSCEECGSGTGLTFSGTVPQANHTIAADLTILPLGSKVRIGKVIYTVEDKGTSIKGNMIDIYFENHEEAVLHGRTEREVFLIQ